MSSAGTGKVGGFRHQGVLRIASCLCVMAGARDAFGQSGGGCARVITADVVALDQPFYWNRLGAAEPQGMIFALREDVVPLEGSALASGNVMLRSDKRARPLVLRMNVGDCLEVHFQNLLSAAQAHPNQPATRAASVHVIGMQLVNGIADDGSNVGANTSSLVPPGGSATYTFHAEREGPFVLYSAGTTVGGGGNGGSLSAGLFGAVNVQKAGAEWYRSQVTHDDIELARTGSTPAGHPMIDYDAVYPAGHPLAGRPIFRMLDGNNKIRHSDLTAIITGPGRGDFPPGTYKVNPIYPNRDQSFREFTIIYHDEIEASQAFVAFKNPVMGYTLNSVQDSFAINYGTAGIGAEILANRYGVGPMWECNECKYEEFFLSSWAVGDPAMIVDIPANADIDGSGGPTPGAKATKALYPEDPSNVYHSYIGDHVKQRILHGGSQEHHIHHLHAHQWTETPDSDGSTYLDSKAIGPGTSWTLEIPYRGTGNRNQVVGDSIFHCHFYPHFAQGMWSLWRSHDVFEEGTRLDADGRPMVGARALPDAEIAAGTPIPAIVPIPGLVMPPMPQADVDIVQVPGQPGGQVRVTGSGNPGYPFFIPGVHGHRAPHPALDTLDTGGLPRHVVTGGDSFHFESRLDFTKELERMTAIELPETGTPVEVAAMDYHAQRLHPSFTTTGAPGQFVVNGLPPSAGAPYAEPCIDDDGHPVGSMRVYKAADVQLDVVLNKLGWHFPQMRMLALWEDVAATLNGTKPPEPLFFRANSDDCIEYQLTNLVPHYYEMDDFQVRTPTDVMGQHIHLVKFDVTSSDGSGNGWNYEDASFSPDEVRERMRAIRAQNVCLGDEIGGGDPRDGTFECPVAEVHPFFGAGPGGEWIGAQTTIQRWYADDVLNNAGEDRTLRTVFTHDHFAPSTHQQAGLYAGLVIEPRGSSWRDPETGAIMGSRSDGGPTSFKADILTPDPADSYREFMIEFADYQLAYRPGNSGFPDPASAILPPGVKVDEETGAASCPGGMPPPCPEAVSDIGTEIMSLNYRNEPLEERMLDPATGLSATGEVGDLSHAMRSFLRENAAVNVQPSFYPPLTSGVGDTDPFTPLLRAYENDKVQMRILVGAQTDLHNFSIHGLKWLFEPSDPNSGYRNSQPMGISEHFEFEFTLPPSDGPEAQADYLYQPDSGLDGLQHTGLWGILRAYDGDVALRDDLLTLPNNTEGRAPLVNATDFNGVCPVSAAVRQYDVVAISAEQALPGGTLVYNSRATAGGPIDDPEAMLYVRSEDLDANLKLLPSVPVEPLVLRAAAGECIEVTLHNMLLPDSAPFRGSHTASYDVGLHPQLVSYDVVTDDGANVGANPKQTVSMGQSRTYRWYAGRVDVNPDGTRTAIPVEFGATNLMPSDGIEQTAKGLIGALIIEPQGAVWVEDSDARASATVTRADGSSFREFVLMFQDTVRLRSAAGFDLDKFPVAINYRTEPMWQRMGYNPGVTTAQQTNNMNFAGSLSNSQVGSDPVTPIFTAEAGTPVRFRVLHPGGVSPHTFQIHGHVWQEEPYVNNSTEIGDNPLSEWKGARMGHGPTSHFDAVLQHGAGGKFAVAGDYLYQAFTADEFDAGIWGIFRVTPGPQPCTADIDCEDGVPCTVDVCNGSTGRCDHTPDDSVCDNALFCDGVEFCNPISGCQPGVGPCPGQGCDEAASGCYDNCPGDPFKFDPGFCGCGAAEDDTDSDGTPDCVDLCPQDPNKIEPGNYGCGHAETGVPVGGDGGPAIGAIIVGVIERLRLDDPEDVWSGGVVVVGGQIIIVPRNMVIELPANFLSLQQIFAQAPAACVAVGESGLASHDECLRGGPGGVATVLANRTAQGDMIAGDVFIEKGQELVTGRVTLIDHTDGYFRLNGRSGDDGTGVMVRVNDPDGRHTIQQGAGCAGGANCSPDPRFTNDPDNYTVVFSTGYPACLPSTVTGGQRSAGSDVNGAGDPFCPATNRGVDPVPDSTRFAPIQVGDFVTAQGNFETINGVRFLSAYDVRVQDALVTADDPTQPDYMIFDEVEWDAPGFQNERVRLLLIGFSTHPDSQLDMFSLHVDPTTNENHETPLASTVGNPLTIHQGVGFANAGIFKIRYDIDFLVGAPVDPLTSACVNLQNAGLASCATVNDLAPEFSVVSPITRELIGRTRHKQANPGLHAFDIRGNDAPWGEYLTPVGVSHPEFVEINLDALQTPFIFGGIPWNLDRRLSPAGCVDTDGDGHADCEGVPQPLDPFPFSRLDPRTQALVPIQARNRILSVFGSAGPATTLLGWPPPDPPFIGAVATRVDITRATFKEEVDCTKIDVWAESDLPGDLVVSGVGLSPQTMVGDGGGRFFAHVSLPIGVPVPSSVTVTQTTTGVTDERALRDEVAVVAATYDVASRELVVSATSSTSSGSSSLAMDGGVVANANGALTLVGVEVPPRMVTMTSAVGGSETRQVSVNPTAADVLTVTHSGYEQFQGRWTISGTSSAVGPGHAVMAYLGAPVFGTLIGAGPVDAAGHWEITTAMQSSADPTSPGAPSTISVQSTPLGGVLEGVPFDVN